MKIAILQLRQIKIKGSSLIETVIYTGLFLLFIAVLTEIFFSSVDIQLETEAHSNVGQDGRYIVAKLIYDVSRASDIVTPVNVGNQGNSLQIIINGVTVTYQLNGTNLTLTNDLVVNQLNGYSTSVANLNFARLGNSGGNNVILSSFTVNSKTILTSGIQTKDFQISAGLRSKF